VPAQARTLDRECRYESYGRGAAAPDGLIK
jgi:hypothetical protein